MGLHVCQHRLYYRAIYLGDVVYPSNQSVAWHGSSDNLEYFDDVGNNPDSQGVSGRLGLFISVKRIVFKPSALPQTPRPRPTESYALLGAP